MKRSVLWAIKGSLKELLIEDTRNVNINSFHPEIKAHPAFDLANDSRSVNLTQGSCAGMERGKDEAWATSREGAVLILWHCDSVALGSNCNAGGC